MKQLQPYPLSQQRALDGLLLVKIDLSVLAALKVAMRAGHVKQCRVVEIGLRDATVELPIGQTEAALKRYVSSARQV